MARTPRLPTEYVTAGDGYDIVFRRADATVAEHTWTAQARATNDGAVLATFEVTTTDGAGDHAGKAVVALHLDGTVTDGLPSSVVCDLQENTPDSPPLTLARWRLVVEGQVTQP